MKLIVGLGNYGDEYLGTRHNVGFMAVDSFVSKIKNQNQDWKLNSKGSLLYTWIGDDVEVIKPQTYMNKSGKAVQDVRSSHDELKPEDILVIHDDWSFEVGESKIQFGKGANRHNGVQSIIDTLGTRDFWRIRIGIGDDFNRQEYSASDYVLATFTRQEMEQVEFLINAMVIPTIDKWLTNEVETE